jgi:hyperosmotically inducible periplasmic protein
MKPKFAAAAAAAAAVAAIALLPGCAVTRGQETVGAYVDDAAITTAVKAKFVQSTSVDASAIEVETLNGEVILSGFARSEDEREMADNLARNTSGVKAVHDELVVRG